MMDYEKSIRAESRRAGETEPDRLAKRVRVTRALAKEHGDKFECPYCGAGKPRPSLTPRQANVLRAIREHLAEHDYGPSFDDLKSRTGIKSKSNIHDVVRALAEHSYITFVPRKSRSIAIIEGRA